MQGPTLCRRSFRWSAASPCQVHSHKRDGTSAAPVPEGQRKSFPPAGRFVASRLGGRVKSWKLLTLVLGNVVFGLVFFSVVAAAQVDPGPRAGSSTAASVSGLTQSQLNAFNAGMASFQEVEDVAHSGLGP